MCWEIPAVAHLTYNTSAMWTFASFICNQVQVSHSLSFYLFFFYFFYFKLPVKEKILAKPMAKQICDFFCFVLFRFTDISCFRKPQAASSEPWVPKKKITKAGPRNFILLVDACFRCLTLVQRHLTQPAAIIHDQDQISFTHVFATVSGIYLKLHWRCKL